MSEQIETKTADLIGAALDWAVLFAIHGDGPDWRLWEGKIFLIGLRDIRVGMDGIGEQETIEPFHPSTRWQDGGPLIQKYNVLLTPPTDLVHRNFGSFDKRNGWYESGHWGSTIFGKERKHRRASFHHPNSPLIVAMRAIVQFELGDTVQVPAELAQLLNPA